MCNHQTMSGVRAALRSGRRLSRRTAMAGTLGLAAAGIAGAAHSRQTGAAGQSGHGSALGRAVDLTHPLSADFPVYPGYAPFSAVVTSTIDGIGSLSRQVTMEEHVGTHVDAPAHFAADGNDVSAIPADQLIAPLVVIDIADRAAEDADATVTVDDILAWESDNGDLPKGVFIAMRSGWDRRANDAASFLNAGPDGVLHFPAWSPDAATFLVEEREIVGLGVDTLSMDNATSPTFESHVILLGAGHYGVENLAGLGEVPPAGATIIVGAPRFAGGSGGPARVLALV